MKSKFNVFSRATARGTGHPLAFVGSVAVVIVWATLGPVFKFSDTWQLVINTGTTIITFLMVFLIQNTQNRDSEAIHLKLDEIIRSIDGAQNALLNLEELDDEELEGIRKDYLALAEAARNELGERLSEEANAKPTAIKSTPDGR
ncbi:MAG: low affinity iron permease family protein [Candidatus Sumerlaeota bacterium]